MAVAVVPLKEDDWLGENDANLGRQNDGPQVSGLRHNHVACIILSYTTKRISMDQKRVPMTVSLPPRLARKFERMAKAQSKNKSQLFREMIQVYDQHRAEAEFLEIQRYGVRQARKRGVLTEEDVEALVFKDR